MEEAAREPLDMLLDVVLYAPIGLLFSGPELIDRFAAEGRQQVQNARAMGQFAIDRGASELESARSELGELLGGLLMAAARAAGAPLAGGQRVEPHDTEFVAATEEPAPARLRVVPSAPLPGPDSLPIPDYDSLSASQVVPRLDALDAAELEAVGAYESAHRHRMTILNRIAKLRAS